jgi:hypothetical protein
MHDDLMNLSVSANMGTETLDWLIDEIRETTSLNDLCHLVGPSELSAHAYEWRRGRLKDLSPLCAWGKQEHQLTTEESEARADYRRIDALQNKFESKYC